MRQFIRRGLSALMLAAVLVVGATATATVTANTDSPGGVQLMCPVMTDEKIDPDISTEYQGQTVYFCCQKCRVKFEAAPQRYASSIVTVLETVDDQASDNVGDATQGSGEHGHSKDHGQASDSTAISVLTSLGRFHPMAVHFPIALLISAALARCLMLLGSIRWAGPAVRFCVLLGGASAVGAAVLGWLNAGYPAEGEAFGDVLFNHRWLGVSAAVVGVILIFLVEKEARTPSKALSRLTTLALLVGAGLVGAAGHFGGIMVFGPDYLPW